MQLSFDNQIRARKAVIAWLVCLVVLFPLANAFSQPEKAEDRGPVPVKTTSETDNEKTEETGDNTEGKKKAVESKTVIPTTPVELILALKEWVVPFGLATLIAVWFSTERLVVLRRGRVIPKPFVERFLMHLQKSELSSNEALQICEENGSPVAYVFAHGVRKWGKPSVEVEQAIIDGGERQVSDLRRHLRVINGVATVCPLIGLLGTVWGMIDAFNGIASADAMGSPEKLAAGIALALLTTAAGLLIAIPSLIIYLYLSGRVDRLVMDMDDLAQQVVHHISAEGLQGLTPVSRKPPQKPKNVAKG